MVNLFFGLALIAGLNNAVLIVLIKTGVVDHYRLYRPRFMPENCNFCFFFWLSFLQMLQGFKLSLKFLCVAFCLGLIAAAFSLIIKRAIYANN